MGSGALAVAPAVFVSCDFRVRLLSDSNLHQQGADLMGALLELEKCTDDLLDSSTATDSGELEVTVSVTISTADEVAAFKRAMQLIRTAIHMIGGATPDWPDDRDVEQSVAVYLEGEKRIELVDA